MLYTNEDKIDDTIQHLMKLKYVKDVKGHHLRVLREIIQIKMLRKRIFELLIYCNGGK